MPDPYAKLIGVNLERAFQKPAAHLQRAMGARSKGGILWFQAFGEMCTVSPKEIRFEGTPRHDVRALLVSLYALHADSIDPVLEPFRAFRDLPGSMPYQSAFTANTERVLIPYAAALYDRQERIKETLEAREGFDGDFSLILHPLPKIALCYIFFLEDDEFPASVTCLFSHNATAFMPLDGLADVGEYTSKKIMSLVHT